MRLTHDVTGDGGGHVDFYVLYALIVGLVGFLRVPEIRRFRLSVANFFGQVTLNMESLIDR
jgi:hypothetical protein